MDRGWAERERQGEAMERRRGGDLERTGGPIGPFQRMIESVDSMFDQMQRSFFGSPFGTPWGEGRGGEGPIQRMARIEVEERDDELVLTAELPGIDPNQVHIEARNDVLTIRGERQDQRSEGEGRRYQSYTSFYRQIPLPSEVDLDKAQASFKHGLLELRLPRRESGSGTRRIPITSGTAEEQGGSQSERDRAA